MNETLDSIKNRRSIRKYQEKQISEEALQLILEAATYAPSGSNNQSWLFTAIQNREALRTLNQMVRHAFLEMELAENEYPAKINAKKLAQSENYNFYYN
ncbi:MAG: nitroreductase family protein, partial [Syntrophomonas sp.]